MKRFLISLIFSFGCLFSIAQQDRFVYLQTENSQPFFVKVDSKVLTSSPSGYLIIPKLNDGLYSMVIGFPGNLKEQEFNCSINKKDIGFIIKNVGEQWQLMNVQTLSMIVPGGIVNKPLAVYDRETDAFSTMLATAVNDPTILQKDIAKSNSVEKSIETLQKDSATPITVNIVDSFAGTSKTENNLIRDSVKNDNPIAPITEKADQKNPIDSVQIVALANDVIVKPENVSASASIIKKEEAGEIVTKKSDEFSNTNKEIAIAKPGKKKVVKKSNAKVEARVIEPNVAIIGIQTEKANENKDSIQSIYSNTETEIVRSIIKRRLRKAGKDGLEMIYVDDDGDTKDTIKILIPSEKKVKKAEEIKMSEPIISAPNSQADNSTTDERGDKPNFKISKQEKQIIKEANNEGVVKSSMPNSDCKSIATEDDFLKLRKKIVAENNDDNMIKAAKKTFKIKCFTTEQIKNLSVLFLVDESKYLFFEAAYPFVSDSDIYYTLEKQLSDNNYITKFKTMIHK
ncbi:MAG TPA: DUF4476 domain-containing protein [Sphingobacteriaceae bacterium]|nr:DUF4476 domain-containing protein [Sphingobacteriaceae bacterium]